MSVRVKWFACKRDIGITILLSIITFISLPFLMKGWKDTWPLTMLYIAIMVFIETLLVCEKHFWAWTIISTYSITLASFLGFGLFWYPDSYSRLDIVSEIQELFINGLYFLMSSLPLATISYACRKKHGRISAYLLLWPLAWFAGFTFSDGYYHIDVTSRGMVMNIAILAGITAGIIFVIAAIRADRSTGIKEYTQMQMISVVAWLLAGIFPGVVGFGWKFSLLASVLPAIVIYHYFELGKRSIND